MNLPALTITSVCSALFMLLSLKASADAVSPVAQTLPRDVVQLFDAAAAKQKRELIDLRASRGAPVADLPDASARSIARVLAVRADDSYAYDRHQATYPKKTAVLFYAFAQGNLQAWLLDEKGMRAYHQQFISEQQISETILQVRNALGVDSLQVLRSPHPRGLKIMANSDLPKRSSGQAIAALTRLLLPTTIADRLEGIRHLIIVPVLGLGTVPYAILQPFKESSFLIDRMSISIAPSLFDLGVAMPPWVASVVFSSPLIVGNPLLPKDTEWVIPPLPGAEQEAWAVAEQMKAAPLIGQAATKATVITRIETSSLLYFATHGAANSSNPLAGGFLMLSAPNLEQGWLTAREVQSLRLRRTRLAVLSACQTGLGKTHNAGIIGLARAFQIAGVQRVVMSLWSVDDQATRVLMQSFVRHLQDQDAAGANPVPSEALRLAMLEVRKEYPKPSQWASFVLFGTPR